MQNDLIDNTKEFQIIMKEEEFVKLKIEPENNKEKEKRLIRYFLMHKNVKLLFRTVENELFSFCVFRSMNELEQLWRTLKKEYGNIVQKMSYYVMSEEIKLEMWPLNI